MERRSALATAGAVALTAATAAVAIGANFGLFGLTDGHARIGKLSPVAATSSSVPSTELPSSTKPTSTPTRPREVDDHGESDDD